MGRLAVEWGFHISLFCGMPLGILLMILWGRRIFGRLKKAMEQQPHLDISWIAMRSLVLMLPGLLIFVLCCVPALYFGDLRKQRVYCLKVIEVNEGIAKDNPWLIERCGCLDLDELFEEHAARGG